VSAATIFSQLQDVAGCQASAQRPAKCAIIFKVAQGEFSSRVVFMLQLLQIAFRDLLKTLRALFLETMGVLFLVIGVVITFNGYKQLRRYLDFGEVSYFGIVSTFVFGILMLGYGVHSFYQVRKMK
jgi:hypothetical protein